MIDRKAKEAGIFTPSEVALLARVFESTAIENETDEDREARASHIIVTYLASVTDENDLGGDEAPTGSVIGQADAEENQQIFQEGTASVLVRFPTDHFDRRTTLYETRSLGNRRTKAIHRDLRSARRASRGRYAACDSAGRCQAPVSPNPKGKRSKRIKVASGRPLLNRIHAHDSRPRFSSRHLHTRRAHGPARSQLPICRSGSLSIAGSRSYSLIMLTT